MKQAETIEQTDARPFWMLQASGGYETTSQLRERIEWLKRIIAFQDERISALKMEIADLHRLLGLRGEAAALEQQIEQRNTE